MRSNYFTEKNSKTTKLMLKLSQWLQPNLQENVCLVQVIRRKGKAGLIRD